MPKQKKGVIRHLLSFLFGLIGGLLALGLTTLMMIQVTLKTANANTDKPGVGILFTFWMFGIPMIFAIGAALGVKCVDGLYWLRSPANDPTSEKTDKANGETPREAALRQIAEWSEAEKQSSFWLLRYYRKYQRLFAQLVFELQHPGHLHSLTKTTSKPAKQSGPTKNSDIETTSDANDL